MPALVTELVSGWKICVCWGDLPGSVFPTRLGGGGIGTGELV
jgi:hypothetical protein